MDENQIEILIESGLQRVLLDTTVLIRALGGQTQDPKAPACVALFDALVKKRRKVLIAAPTLAEVLRWGSGKKPPKMAHVEVVGFDERAAELLAEHFPERVFGEWKIETGLSIPLLKYDALIIATAMRHLAQVFVSIDAKQGRLASSVKLDARTPADFLAPQQGLKFAP